jgi:hypothetical protein
MNNEQFNELFVNYTVFPPNRIHRYCGRNQSQHSCIEACTTETSSRMLKGEGIVTVIKHHGRHVDRSPTDALISISSLQRIP